MRTIFQLAWSFFKEGRKKYIMCAGIFMSVLCLTSLFIYIQSYDMFQKKQILYIHSEYEYIYNDSADLEEFYQFLPEENRGEAIELISYGKARVDDKTVALIALSHATEKGPLPLMKGHYPASEKEILMSNYFMDTTSSKVGDAIELNVTSDSGEVYNKSFIISGAYYHIGNYDEFGNIQDQMVMLSPIKDNSKILYGYISLKNMTLDKINKLNEELKLHPSINVHPDYDVINILYGNYETMALKDNIKYFVILFLMILQILMNMFFVSMNEKKQYIGMLKSIGLSKKQLLLYSFFETIIYSVFMVTLGIVASYILMYFALPYFASLEPEYSTPFTFPLILNAKTVVLVYLMNFTLLFICNLFAYTSCRKYSVIQLVKSNFSNKIRIVHVNDMILNKENIEKRIAYRYRNRNFISNFSVFIAVCSCIIILIIGNFLYQTANDMMIENYENATTVGNYMKTLILGLSIFLITIAIVNQFITMSASIIAKKKEYMILISTGLTKKQLLRLLFFEYGSVVITGVVVGMGISICYVYYYFITYLAQEYDWMFDWFLVFKVSFIFILFSILSVFYGYFVLSKQKIIETIKE